jgi:hypothetical protein
MQGDNLSGPLSNFRSKLTFFYAFNLLYFVWAALCLVFYIIITSGIACPGSTPAPTQ